MIDCTSTALSPKLLVMSHALPGAALAVRPIPLVSADSPMSIPPTSGGDGYRSGWK